MVFLVLGSQHHARDSLSVGFRLVTRYRSNEVQALSAAIGHIIGPAEIRQIGNQRVALHLHRVVGCQVNSPSSLRIHHQHINRIVPAGQRLRNLGSRSGLPFHSLCRGGTARKRSRHHDNNNPVLHHAANIDKNCEWCTAKAIIFCGIRL